MVLQKVESVEEILKLVFASGYIKNAYPVSTIIVANVGCGKTSILKKFSVTEGVAYITDVTAYGIINTFYKEIKEKNIKHLIIPDLIAPLSKAKSTVNTFISFINALIEEGILRISTYAIDIEEPIKCGLVTAIAKEDLFSGHRKETWHRVGFLSRMIPISYSYSKVDILNMLETMHKNLVDTEIY